MAKKKTGKKNIPTETERKFLLKRFPKKLLLNSKKEVLNIVQYYFNIDNVWQRFRISQNANTKKIKYVHTIKGPQIGLGTCLEDEKTITKKKFEEILKKSGEGLVIEKTRFVVKYKGFKFEIDLYKKLHLITLEVELPTINTRYEYPPGLEEEIIYELTGIKQFSNQSLASKIKFRKDYSL